MTAARFFVTQAIMRASLLVLLAGVLLAGCGTTTANTVLTPLAPSPVTMSAGHVRESSVVIWARRENASTLHVAVASRDALGAQQLDSVPLDAAHDFTGQVRVEGLVERLVEWRAGRSWGYPWNYANGRWTTAKGRIDLSNTQFAVLGLRAARKAGIEVEPRVWSDLVEDTLAWLVIEPVVPASTSTVTVICFAAPAAILPREQVGTPPGSSAQPSVDPKLTPEGRVSVTTTFCASDGPLFCTVKV